MSDVQRALAKDEPMMIAWEAYKKTPDFANTLKWAKRIMIQNRDDGTLEAVHPNLEGSLWGVFMAAWMIGTQRICEHSTVKVFSNGVLACEACGKENIQPPPQAPQVPINEEMSFPEFMFYVGTYAVRDYRIDKARFLRYAEVAFDAAMSAVPTSGQSDG